MSRRTALAVGAGASAALLAGGTALAAPPRGGKAGGLRAVERIRRAYAQQKARAGGAWYSYVTRVNGTGVMEKVIEDDADHVVHGYSVQKLAVATARCCFPSMAPDACPG